MGAEKAGKRGINLYPSEWEGLRQLAYEDDTTVSEQVRRAVVEYLKRRRKKRGDLHVSKVELMVRRDIMELAKRHKEG